MKIYIEKNNLAENLYNFMRKCGYQPLKDSYVKPLANFGYPRFHVYSQETENQYILNLHLDQKKPSYGKEKAHSGEYKGEIVEQEAERITCLIKQALYNKNNGKEN